MLILIRWKDAGWGHTSCAGEVGRHGDGDVEVFSLGLGEAVHARDVVGNGEVGLACGT